VGDYTSRLAAALVKAGARVTVVTSAAVSAPLKIPGVTVHPVVSSWGAWNTSGLGQRLQALQPDSVQVMYPSLGYGRGWAPNLILGWLAKHMPACGRILTLHEYAMFSWLGQWRLRPALAAAQAVVCTNHLDRRALRRIKPARVIPLGSAVASGQGPVSFFSAGPRAVVHFGTVMPNKGWETLLPAWNLLRAQGCTLALDVPGELETGRYAYHRRIEKLIRQAGLPGQVRFLGYLPPSGVRRAFAQSCGMAVLPFRGGARLNRSSLVAALAAGLAVVTTRPPQPLEGLRHGKNIWLVEPGDAGALAAGVRRLAEDPRLRRRLQAGARRAARRFAWPRIARQMLALFREVKP
jgi:glycosyltransferase involved in cell wall biosynthesis